jgi:hypothetical protein
MTRHHWQCDWNLDQGPECNCGLTGVRAWWMDHLPHDRAPTFAEAQAWRHAIRAKEADMGDAHEPAEGEP